MLRRKGPKPPSRANRPAVLVHCWNHLRRRFVKQMRNTKSPIAEAAVRQIAALYAIEATMSSMVPEEKSTSVKSMRGIHAKAVLCYSSPRSEMLIWKKMSQKLQRALRSPRSKFSRLCAALL